MIAEPVTRVPAEVQAATPPRIPAVPKADNVAPLRKRYYLTEMGNADRFVDQHRDAVLFCPAYGWLVYRAGKWCRNCDHLVRSRVQKTIRSMQREAGELEVLASKETDKDRREKLIAEAETLRKWARHSETEHMVKAMLALAEPHLTVDASMFDSDRWLLNVKNGTLDLRTFQLRPHRREDCLMKQAGVAYEPGAPSSTYLQWIEDITCGDKDLAKYLQQLMGYSTTGDTAEQKFFMGKGPGGNGKSTLMDLMRYVMGDYAAEVNPDTLTASSFTRSGAEPSPDLVRLAGARFVIASETEQGARLKAALIKRLSGGDPITARDLHRSPVEYYPQFKLFIDTNHLPQVRDRGYAFWRRARLIPFNYKITNADPTIEGRLKAEGAGILAWMIQGLRDYLAAGRHLPACRAVEVATKEYQTDQDIIGLFLRDKCIADRRAEQPSQELYNAFSEWVEQQMGERPMAQRSFTQALEELGYTSRRTRAGMVWSGVRLRTDYDTDPEPEPTPDTEQHQTEQLALVPSPAAGPDAQEGAPADTAEPWYTGEVWYDASRPDSALSQALTWACHGNVERATAWMRSRTLREHWNQGQPIAGMRPSVFAHSLHGYYARAAWAAIKGCAQLLDVDVQGVLAPEPKTEPKPEPGPGPEPEGGAA